LIPVLGPHVARVFGRSGRWVPKRRATTHYVRPHTRALASNSQTSASAGGMHPQHKCKRRTNPQPEKGSGGGTGRWMDRKWVQGAAPTKRGMLQGAAFQKALQLGQLPNVKRWLLPFCWTIAQRQLPTTFFVLPYFALSRVRVCSQSPAIQNRSV
jgi:hypothetical protein